MTKNRKIVIGTRGSKLAVWQAEWVKSELERLHPGLEVELNLIKTTGDKILDVPLSKVGGKGLFVKEIEESLLKGESHLAVHSMKDVPTELPDGLHISVICRREDPRDAFVAGQMSAAANFRSLRHSAVIGTSSLRRSCQLLNIRPDLKIEQLRGNLDTRLRKLDEGRFDAIILAAAGLKRLGLTGRITELLPPEVSLPAIAQGAIGIECRTDSDINELIAPLNDPEASVCVRAERAFLRKLEGGCQVPIAAHARTDSGTLIMDGLVGNLSGDILIRDHIEGSPSDAEALGIELAGRLLNRGAKNILDEVYRQNMPQSAEKQQISLNHTVNITDGQESASAEKEINKHMTGHTVLITREYNTDYKRLEDLGAAIYEFQTIMTVPPADYSELDASIEALDTYHWLVFTSAGGPKYFMPRLLEKGKSIDDLKGLKICAIGTKTAEAVSAYGLTVDMIPEEFNAEGLITAFIKDAKTRQDPRYKTSNLLGLRILLPRSEAARETFPERIRELEGEIDCPVAYHTVNPSKYDAGLHDLLKSGGITVATFTSAAAFNNFIESMGSEAMDSLNKIAIAAIGPVTAKAIEAKGLKVAIMPKKATIEAMVEDIADWASGGTEPC